MERYKDLDDLSDQIVAHYTDFQKSLYNTLRPQFLKVIGILTEHYSMSTADAGLQFAEVLEHIAHYTKAAIVRYNKEKGVSNEPKS